MKILCNIVFTIIFCQGLVWSSFSQKNDTLYLLNGDRITGEIKSLEFAKLKFKTNHSSTIYVDWDDLATLHTTKFLDISLSDGTRLFASLYKSNDTGYAVIQELVGSKPIRLDRIVAITPIKNTFWSRIDGVIEVGGSYTKASEVTQLNGKFNAEYREQRWLAGFRNSFIWTEQPERPTTSKGDVNLYFTRFILGNWHLQGSANLERNTELGLDWRMLYGGNLGHDFLRTVHASLEGSVGVYYNGEKGLDSAVVTSSVESAVSVGFRKLKTESPKVDVYTQFTIFPSLTESERVRMQYDLQTNFEIVVNFYVGIDFYFTYDNKPRSLNAERDDYGIVGKIGYSF